MNKLNKDTIVHGAKVASYVIISSAASGLLAFLANAHPSQPMEVLLIALINSILAMAVKRYNTPQ